MLHNMWYTVQNFMQFNAKAAYNFLYASIKLHEILTRCTVFTDKKVATYFLLVFSSRILVLHNMWYTAQNFMQFNAKAAYTFLYASIKLHEILTKCAVSTEQKDATYFLLVFSTSNPTSNFSASKHVINCTKIHAI